MTRLTRLARRGYVVSQSMAARVIFGVAAVGLAVWAIADRRAEVFAAVHRIDSSLLAAAAGATLLNLLFTGLTWRAVLADLGSPLPVGAAARIFFVGQVGKYLPGSLWPVVVQAELGREHGVSRRRSAAATLIFILLSAVSAMVVVLAAAPFVPAVASSGLGWTLILVVPLIVMLHPKVIGRLLDRLLRLLGRPALTQWTSFRGTAKALGWALASWSCAGLQVWLLVLAIGGPWSWRSLFLAIGGYAFAWAVGLLFVVAPAGAGAREVALAAILGSVLDRGAVVVVVLLSRVLFSLGDLLLAGLGLTMGRGGRSRSVSDPAGTLRP